MNLFIGLDVSLASTAICVLTAHGKVVGETTPLAAEHLKRFAKSCDAPFCERF